MKFRGTSETTRTEFLDHSQRELKKEPTEKPTARNISQHCTDPSAHNLRTYICLVCRYDHEMTLNGGHHRLGYLAHCLPHPTPRTDLTYVPVAPSMLFSDHVSSSSKHHRRYNIYVGNVMATTSRKCQRRRKQRAKSFPTPSTHIFHSTPKLLGPLCRAERQVYPLKSLSRF